MKDTGYYEIWKPIPNLPNDLVFISMKNESGDLVVLLKELDNQNRLLQFVFKNIIGYRVFPEGSRLKTINDIPSFGGFRISSNSEFLKWFKEESGGIFEEWNLKHYLICNMDNIIDVISGSSVNVEWVNL